MVDSPNLLPIKNFFFFFGLWLPYEGGCPSPKFYWLIPGPALFTVCGLLWKVVDPLCLGHFDYIILAEKRPDNWWARPLVNRIEIFVKLITNDWLNFLWLNFNHIVYVFPFMSENKWSTSE